MSILRARISFMNILLISLLCIMNYLERPALAWHDETHIAVAKAAGYYKWYNAAGADITKLKAGSIEAYNHFFDNPSGIEITPEFVLKQARLYNNPRHREGHLYGAIIASLREYLEAFEGAKYAEYHLAFCVHYLTDLAQPLHNVPYDKFNRTHHKINDGIVNKKILDNLYRLKKYMYSIKIERATIMTDLAREIARIANISRDLGYRLKKEGRDMTPDEAYRQLGHSASLIKALLMQLKRKHF